jgi:hypothetical protein
MVPISLSPCRIASIWRRQVFIKIRAWLTRS